MCEAVLHGEQGVHLRVEVEEANGTGTVPLTQSFRLVAGFIVWALELQNDGRT